MAINKTAAKKLSNNELHAYLIKASGGCSQNSKFKGICSTTSKIDRGTFEILYIEAESRDKVNMVKGKPCHIKAAENLDYFSSVQANKLARLAQEQAKEDKKKEQTA